MNIKRIIKEFIIIHINHIRYAYIHYIQFMIGQWSQTTNWAVEQKKKSGNHGNNKHLEKLR